jgi:hypothetical protein
MSLRNFLRTVLIAGAKCASSPDVGDSLSESVTFESARSAT